MLLSTRSLDTLASDDEFFDEFLADIRERPSWYFAAFITDSSRVVNVAEQLERGRVRSVDDR